MLLLDIARFKYSPHWVSLDKSYESVNTCSKNDLTQRGFLFCFNKINPDLNFYNLEIKDHEEGIIPINHTNFNFVNSPKDFEDMKYFLSNCDSVNSVHRLNEIPECFMRLCTSYLISKEWMVNTNDQVNTYYNGNHKKI